MHNVRNFHASLMHIIWVICFRFSFDNNAAKFPSQIFTFHFKSRKEQVKAKMPTFLALIFNSFPKSQQLTVHKQNNEKQNMKIFLFKQLQYSEFKKSFCFFLDEFGSNDLNVLKLDPFQRKLI